MKTKEPFSLANEVALVTGGGTGIGLAIAQCLAAAGAKVVVAGRDRAQLEQAAAAIGPAASAMPYDVTAVREAPAFIASVEALVGPLSILVNNAGNHLKKPALDTTEEEFAAILDTHVLGAHALSRAAAAGMLARGRGSILFTASMASLFGIPGVVAYSAAKSAHLGLVRALATEWSPHGVRVNAVAPGWIDSAMSRRAMAGDPGRRDRILARTPLGRFGDAEDVGWAAVYLCSPAARFVTGVVLPVDGGISIGF